MVTNNSSEYGDSIQATPDMLYDLYAVNHYTIIALYIPVYILALTSNIIVIVVVFKDQYMRSVTNYFLVNLSVADLLVTLVCMPNAAWLAYTTMYNFGEYSCKVVAYLQCISVASSIFTITVMALDRYLAITSPFGMVYRCFSRKTTVIVIVSLWLMSLILFSPTLWIYNLTVDVYPTDGNLNVTVAVCVPEWGNFFISQHTLGIVWFIFMFANPGIIMVFAYTMMGRTLCSGMPNIESNDSACAQQRDKVMKDRKRIACTLLLLAFIFFVCWLPYHISNLIKDTATNSSTGSNEEAIILKRYLLLLGHANSALNPIIYCALSRKFRKSIKSLFNNTEPFRRKRNIAKWTDTSASGAKLQRLKMSPQLHNQFTLSSGLQSSQKQISTYKI